MMETCFFYFEKYNEMYDGDMFLEWDSSKLLKIK